MSESPHLIVMLTHNDQTVNEAYEIFEQCKNSKALFWGLKEQPLSKDKMKALYRYMKKYGKTTILEVVEYTEKKCLQGAETAFQCGCDILMGTRFFDSVNIFCKEHNLKYMPFVGKVIQRPSVLEGTTEEILKDAQSYLDKGIYGFDLLSYRKKEKSIELTKQFLSKISLPVCVAGSIDSYEKLDFLKEALPWGFTIGSAFFEHKFGNSFLEQIDNVCNYIKKK